MVRLRTEVEILQQNDTHDATVECDVVILRQGGFNNQEGEDALSEKQHDPFTETMDTDCDKKSGREMKYQSLRILKEKFEKSNQLKLTINIHRDRYSLVLSTTGKIE